MKNYFIYILTNPAKTVLYVGVTNNLKRRLEDHYSNKGKKETFAGRYHCYHLVYWEHFSYPTHAIAREKQIKKWSRNKKAKLIEEMNPKWNFLNYDVFTE